MWELIRNWLDKITNKVSTKFNPPRIVVGQPLPKGMIKKGGENK